jgi:hypothetical protein
MSDSPTLIDDEGRPRGRKLHKATMILFLQRNDLLHEPSLRGAFLDGRVSAFGCDEVKSEMTPISNVKDDRVFLWTKIIST